MSGPLRDDRVLTADLSAGEEDWGLLRDRTDDFVHGTELLMENTKAYATAAHLAYVTNGLSIATPSEKERDLAMLSRLLDYVEESLGYVVQDIEGVRKKMAEIEAVPPVDSEPANV